MGFEVTYSFHDRLDGDYNRAETKTMKKRVGDPFEDVPFEKLAVAVMAQLARRDIFVTGVEVFELSKKPVSFRESEGGIVLRNKKFLFGTDAGAVVQQDVPEPAATAAVALPQNVSVAGTQPRTNPIRYMVYLPEPPLLIKAQNRGWKFTPDKKYPIYEAKPNNIGGETYRTVDDAGREQTVPDEYFIPAKTNLLGDRELGFSQPASSRDGLQWGGARVEDNMPVLR